MQSNKNHMGAIFMLWKFDFKMSSNPSLFDGLSLGTVINWNHLHHADSTSNLFFLLPALPCLDFTSSMPSAVHSTSHPVTLHTRLSSHFHEHFRPPPSSSSCILSDAKKHRFYSQWILPSMDSNYSNANNNIQLGHSMWPSPFERMYSNENGCSRFSFASVSQSPPCAPSKGIN